LIEQLNLVAEQRLADLTVLDEAGGQIVNSMRLDPENLLRFRLKSSLKHGSEVIMLFGAQFLDLVIDVVLFHILKLFSRVLEWESQVVVEFNLPSGYKIVPWI
jgi:hypothetical protein